MLDARVWKKLGMDNRLVGGGKVLASALLFYLAKKGFEGTPLYRKLRLAITVLSIALRVSSRRMLVGPKLPSWSFQLELLLEVMRDSVSGGQSRLDEAKFPQARKAIERWKAPLSRSAKCLRFTLPNSSIDSEWIVPAPPKGTNFVDTESKNAVPPLVTYYLDLEMPVVLYLHGGGYVSLSTSTHRAWIGKIAVASNSIALAINYRLAPEHPFPSGLIDSLYAYRWLVLPRSEGGLGIDSSRIIIAGDSAGGGMSLATTLSILHGPSKSLYSPFNYLSNATEGLDEGNFDIKPFELDLPLPRLVVLLSPWTDLECKGKSWYDNSQYCYLVPEPLVCGWYAGHHRLLGTSSNKVPLDHPLLSPINADFTNFPQVLLQVGEKETLYDDSIGLYQQMKKFGVQVNLEVYEDMVHVFQMFGKLAPESSAALSSIAQTIYTSQNNATKLKYKAPVAKL